MKDTIDGKELWRILESSINVESMWNDAVTLSQWERYSGSVAGEASVDFIMKRLQENEVPAKRETYNVYRSLPKSAMVKVLAPWPGRCYAATGCVYAKSCRDLRGEICLDEFGKNEGGLTPLENDKRFASFKDKIVLTHSTDPNFGYLAAQAGALGVIKIWAYDIYHHWPVGDNWGTPNPDKWHKYHPLPFCELKKGDGDELWEASRKGSVLVSMDVEMENSVLPTSMPIVHIQGRSDKFVLISGHYDSWYNGMTDNGCANIMMIEMARIFKENQDKLDRSIVLGWWSGHSDAKYAGSTWYFDNHWEELRKNCVAHIFVDIAGCKTSDEVHLRRTGMEGETFGNDLILKYTGKESRPYVPMPRAGDQSFWGCRHPITIFTRYVESSFFNDDGVQVKPHFYWWHTTADTLDKCSREIILRDTCINMGLACYILNAEHIPVDIPFFLRKLENYLKDIESGLSSDFDLSPVYPLLEKMKQVIPELLETGKDRDTDDIIKTVAGGLNELVFSSTSSYENGPITQKPILPGLNKAKGVTRENTSDTYYLFLQTEFIRQRNRLIGELGCILDEIDNQLLRWKFE